MEQLSFINLSQPSDSRLLVRDLPIRERPVNRLREVGPLSVSTTELLACLLQTSDALHQAQKLLVRFDGLTGLVRTCETELVQVDGIGPSQAARTKAALEIGRRIVLARQTRQAAARASTLIRLAERLVSLPREAIHHIWRESRDGTNFLCSLARRGRHTLLPDLIAPRR